MMHTYGDILQRTKTDEVSKYEIGNFGYFDKMDINKTFIMIIFS